LAHKLREAIETDQQKATFANETEKEVDGAYFGGHRKSENEVAKRADRRLTEEQTGKRQVVVVMRQRQGRTLPFVCAKESDAIPVIRARAPIGSIVHSDEARGWDALHAHYDMRRVNHLSRSARTALAPLRRESFFSRVRRSEIGIHHRISGRYLHARDRDAYMKR
jgi:hypothetical protein